MQTRDLSSDPDLKGSAPMFVERFHSSANEVDTNHDTDSSDEFRRTPTIALLHPGFGEGMLRKGNILKGVT